MKKANNRGCAGVLLLSQKEAAENLTAYKDLSTGEQKNIPNSELISFLEKKLS